MPRYVALLRAVNVAGHGRTRMSVVREAFEAAGCQNVRTVVQTGNIVFDAPAANVTAALEASRAHLRELLGEEPVILLRHLSALSRLVSESPFSDRAISTRGRSQPTWFAPNLKLYVAFLQSLPRRRPRLPLVDERERLEAISLVGREVFVVSRPKPNKFFGFPNNFVEERLGVIATTRNWSTVRKIVECAGQASRE